MSLDTISSEQIANAYCGGLTVAQVARRFNLRESTAYAALVATGTPRRPKGPQPKPKPALKPRPAAARRPARALSEQVEAIAAAYLSGLTLAQTAQRFQSTVFIVRSRLMDAGIPRRPPGNLHRTPAVDDDRAERLVADYLAGQTIKQVAKRHELSYNSVRNCLAEVAVIRSPQGLNRKPVSDTQLIADRRSGLTLDQIAMRHGFCREAVRLRLIKAGIHAPEARPARPDECPTPRWTSPTCDDSRPHPTHGWFSPSGKICCQGVSS